MYTRHPFAPDLPRTGIRVPFGPYMPLTDQLERVQRQPCVSLESSPRASYREHDGDGSLSNVRKRLSGRAPVSSSCQLASTVKLPEQR